MKTLFLFAIIALSIISAHAAQWSQITSVVVANSTTETSLLTGTGVGTKVVDTAQMQPGRAIICTISGFYSSTGVTPTLTIRIKLNGVTVSTATASALLNTTANAGFNGYCRLVIRTTGTTGTIQCGGYASFTGLTGPQRADFINTTANTIDTTAPMTPDVSVQWSGINVANSVTVNIATIDVY